MEIANPIPISSLESLPQSSLPSSSVHGLITLIWPYSSSRQSCAFLLADPDFRQRRDKGQVRVQLSGPAARAFADARAQIGDALKVSLDGAELVRPQNNEDDEQPLSSTPGKSVECEVSLRHVCRIVVERNNEVVATVVVNDPVSPEIESSLKSTPDVEHTYTFLDNPMAKSTPVFTKKARLSLGESTDSLLDPFEGDLDSEDSWNENRKKRARSSWGARKKWRLADRESPPQESIKDLSPNLEAQEVSKESPVNLPLVAESSTLDPFGMKKKSQFILFRDPIQTASLSSSLNSSVLRDKETQSDLNISVSSTGTHNAGEIPFITPPEQFSFDRPFMPESFTENGMFNMTATPSPAIHFQSSGWPSLTDSGSPDLQHRPTIPEVEFKSCLAPQSVTNTIQNSTPRSELLEDSSDAQFFDRFLQKETSRFVDGPQFWPPIEAVDAQAIISSTDHHELGSTFDLINPEPEGVQRVYSNGYSKTSCISQTATEEASLLAVDFNQNTTTYDNSIEFRGFANTVDGSNFMAQSPNFQDYSNFPTLTQLSLLSSQQPNAQINIQTPNPLEKYERYSPTQHAQDPHTSLPSMPLSFKSVPYGNMKENQSQVIQYSEATQSRSGSIVEETLMDPDIYNMSSWLQNDAPLNFIDPATSQTGYEGLVQSQELVGITSKPTNGILENLIVPNSQASRGLEVELESETPIKATETELTMSSHASILIAASKLAQNICGLRTSTAYYTPLAHLLLRLNVPPSTTSADRLVNIIAVVTRDANMPKQAEKGARDYYNKFRIAQMATYPSTTLVSVFRPFFKALPSVRKGDIVLLGSFEVVSLKGATAGLKSCNRSGWCVWRMKNTDNDDDDDDDDEAEMIGPPVEFGEEERQEVRRLRWWWSAVMSEELREITDS